MTPLYSLEKTEGDGDSSDDETVLGGEDISSEQLEK